MRRTLRLVKAMVKWFLAVVLQICLAGIAHAGAQNVRPKKTENPSNSVAHESVKTIPLEIPITNQIYLQARLNNSELPMWFILDTGARSTIIDVDKAKELNIKSERPSTLDLGQTHMSLMFTMDGLDRVLSVKRGAETLQIKLETFPIFDPAAKN